MLLRSPAIVVQSVTGAIIGWDGAAEQTFGYLAQEVIGAPVGLLVHSALSPSLEVSPSSSWDEEIPLVCRTKEGRLFSVTCVRSPVHDGTGQPLAVCNIITAHDDRHVSERPPADAKLQSSRDRIAASLQEAHNERMRLKVILDSTPGVVLTYLRDATGRMRFSYASPRARELLGFTPDQLVRDGELMTSRMHPEDLPALQAQFFASARTGLPFRVEYRYQHPTEGEKWLEARGNPAAGEGDCFIWNGVVLDITERKAAEEQLALTRLQLESALDAAEMGVWVLNCDDNRVWLSEGLRALRNVPAETPDWMSATEAMGLVHPDDLPHVQEIVERALRTGGRLEAEVRIQGPDETVRWVSSRGRAEVYPDGRPRRLVGVDMDITKQKLAADVALRSQKLEALGTLAGGIAHDFNNVLFAIGGNAALALDALTTHHPAHGFLTEIVSASERATELVRQILAFSRPPESRPVVTSLQGPVHEALRLVRTTLPAHIEVVSEVHPKAPAIAADTARIVQLVLNLCTNAAHAIGRGRAGRIDLRVVPLQLSQQAAPGQKSPEPAYGALVPVDPLCSADSRVPDGAYALMEVRDDGCGMDAALQARIFDPFFTTRRMGEGSGLGLSIVHGIMKSLGGYLTVSSTPGRGTTFRLYFPAMTEPPSVSVSDSMPTANGMCRRILFVDDEAMLVTLGRNVLSRLGYEPRAYQDAREALQAFRDQPDSFHAVVTDLSMPAMSGFDLARCLLDLRPDLPIVMVSGYFGPEEREAGSQLGIRHMVDKPVSMIRLGELLADL